MKKSTKKFIMWLIISNVLAIVFVLTLGFIFIKSNYNARFEKLGQGMGSFIVFGNLAAVLIRYLVLRKKNDSE